MISRHRDPEAPHRPVMRWHGGKWKLASWILPHLPPHRVYLEPFAGAASVLMQKPRSYCEILNDLDGDVVNLFRVLRDTRQARQLRRVVRLTPYSREEWDLARQPSEDPVERARRLLVRTCLSVATAALTDCKTGFRSHSERTGSTPAMDWTGMPGVLRAVTERLRGVVIEQRDALELLALRDGPRVLAYVDPPYVHSTRRGPRAGKVYRHEMDDAAHRRLLEVLRGMEGMVVLSGYPCDLYDQALHDWHRVTREAQSDGGRRTEVLWLNPACRAALLGARQADLFRPEDAA